VAGRVAFPRGEQEKKAEGYLFVKPTRPDRITTWEIREQHKKFWIDVVGAGDWTLGRNRSVVG